MALCSPRSCGCAIQSDSLSITGSGSADDPFQIEFGSPLPADLLEIIQPAGTIRATPYATADAGWLLFGASYTNANATYPTLWGKVPAAWKSGTTLVLPTDADMVLRGHTTNFGTVTGAATKTITTAHMPTHVHDMGHGHTASSGSVSNDHAHTFSGTTSNENAEHRHLVAGTSSVAGAAGIGFVAIDWYVAGGAVGAGGWTSPQQENHQHNYAGTTSGITANHNHSITVNNFAGNTGSAGSGSAFNVQEAGINVRFQIKAH